tara:strand:+ start:673 stop:1302 length:630 start_codon:yes stop_codon:yes gene_type:complete
MGYSHKHTESTKFGSFFFWLSLLIIIMGWVVSWYFQTLTYLWYFFIPSIISFFIWFLSEGKRVLKLFELDWERRNTPKEESNNTFTTNYPKTIVNMIINLFVTFWLFLSFISDLNGFINPIKNSDVSIPLLSTLGIVAWFGLFRKKHWGLFCFQGYIVFTIYFQLLDLVYNFGLPTIIQIISTLLIGILLYFHFKKYLGFVWLIKNDGS